MDKRVFPSFESFIYCKEEISISRYTDNYVYTNIIGTDHTLIEILKKYDQEIKDVEKQKKIRETATLALRSLTKHSKKLGIDISVLKSPSKRYLMTPYVCNLFRFILDFLSLSDDYSQAIKEEAFHHIPMELLTELRICYYNALYSVDLDYTTVERLLREYENKTNCPPLNFHSISSPMTRETIFAIQHLLEKNDDVVKLKLIAEERDSLAAVLEDVPQRQLTAAEWNSLAAALEHDYQKTWRPLFINHAYREYKKILEGHVLTGDGNSEIDLNIT